MNFLDIVKVLAVLFVGSIMFGLAILPGILILDWVPEWWSNRRKIKAERSAAAQKEKKLAELEKALDKREKVLNQIEENLDKQQENLDKIEQNLQKKEQNLAKIEQIQEQQQDILTRWAQAHGFLPPQFEGEDGPTYDSSGT